MRKRLVLQQVGTSGAAVDRWLNLAMATAEITSEDPRHPVEGALLDDHHEGWRADQPGMQQLRLHFDQPQDLRRILMEFVEPEIARTQEFVLRWSADGQTSQEVVRQQWNFSPSGATQEIERYDVQLTGVRMLELTIEPDISGGEARASLQRLRLA